MKNYLGLGLVLVMIFSATNLWAAGSLIHEGQWEISAKMEMANMPFVMPPFVWRQCMTNDKMVPMNNQQPGGGDNGNCRMVDSAVKDNSFAWKMVCEEEGGTMVTTGKITYHGDSFVGKIEVSGGEIGVMSQSLTGRRLGTCQ